MAPPSKLSIATSSVQRLLKEEASYHKEQESQLARIQKLEHEPAGENSEFILKQEKQSLEETKAMFGPLKIRIADATSKLQAQLTQDENEAPAADVEKAKTALSSARSSG